MLSWEGLREFIAVVETGSFSMAARQLGTSVAQVSRKVGALESRLDAKLFYRNTRKVSITEAGSTYYHYCNPAIESLEEAERAISELQLRPKGNLRMTAPVSYGQMAIMPIINEYMKSYSDVKVDVFLANKKIDIIEEGYDLSIRLGALESSNLIAQKLTTRKLYVCASPAYLSDHGPINTLPHLNNHNCLLGTLDYWRFEENSHEKTIKVKGNFRCNNGPSLLNAALMGLGIVQLPNYYVDPYIKTGELVPLLEEYQTQDEGIWALYPENRHLSLKVKTLIEFLKQGLSGK